MDFSIARLLGDKKLISPGSIAGKIKKYRELRELSQKELGLKCGFSASTADVRIAQYEKGNKIPRERALKEIASALEISEFALFDADLLYPKRMYHALFDMEDFHGLRPIKKQDGYYLEFYGTSLIEKRSFNEFLEIWYNMKEKYAINPSDSKDEQKRKAKEYALWRAEYPDNVDRESAEYFKDKIRMAQLQDEMDALNAKMKNDEELSKLDSSIEKLLPSVRSSAEPIEKASDLIYLIKAIMESGLTIRQFSPQKTLLYNHDYMQLLSISTNDILSNNENKQLYAQLVYALDSLENYNIKLVRRITSSNNNLYVTYLFLPDQLEYFSTLTQYWNDMTFIIEKKEFWSSREIEELEDKFNANITGDNDILYT